MPTQPHPSRLATFSIVAASSILFCSKGVFAKLAYTHGAGPLAVLTLRMGFALPVFVLLAIRASRGASPLTGVDWARLTGLGFIGYYISSLVNFAGLQYVSVGLERIILYTYPSLILVFSALVLRKRIRPAVWIACFVAWGGIIAAFAGELHHPAANEGTAFGAFLIFCSAVTYAAFLMLGGTTIRRVGAIRFTGIAAGISCCFMLIHFAATRPISELLAFPAPVYGYGLILAVFGTIAPMLLMGIGLQRAGAQQFAVISMIGPVATLLLAWSILGERPNAAQVLGFLLTLGGGIAISLLKDASVSGTQPAPRRQEKRYARREDATDHASSSSRN